MRSEHPSLLDIVLEPGITPERFLLAIIHDFETAARFALDWAEEDKSAAAEFLARFLAKVHRELAVNLGNHYFFARSEVATTFKGQRPSTSSIAFFSFCELLFENPAFVGFVLAHPEYTQAAAEGDPLRYRHLSWIALRRGSSWPSRRYRFGDPEPLPAVLKAEHHRRMHEEAIAHKRARAEREAQRAIEIEALRLARKEARRKEIEPRLREQARRSAEQKAFREHVAAQPMKEQIRLLAEDDRFSIKVFPIDPDTITPDALRRADTETLAKLLQRVSPRWEMYWKRLAERIGAALIERSQPTSSEL